MNSTVSVSTSINQYPAAQEEKLNKAWQSGSITTLFQTSSKSSLLASTKILTEAVNKMNSGIAAANAAISSKEIPVQSINEDSPKTRIRRTAAPTALLASSATDRVRQDLLKQIENNKAEPGNVQSLSSSTQPLSQEISSDPNSGIPDDRKNIARQRRSGTDTKPDSIARINAVMRKEIESIEFSKDPKNIAGSFLRLDSAGQKLIKQMIAPLFEKSAEMVMSSVYSNLESGMKTLHRHASASDIDRVLTKAYQAMMNSLSAIEFPQEFKEIVKKIATTLDETINKQAAGAPPSKAQQMHDLSSELKQGITKALLLRVFTPHIVNFCNTSNIQFGQSAKKIDEWLNENSNVNLSGFKINKIAVLLTTKINQATGQKHEALAEFFPQLIKSMKESDLSSFSALNKLDSSLKTKSSSQ